MIPPVATKQRIANKLLLILVLPLLLQFVAGAFLWGLSADNEQLKNEERALSEKTETRGRQFVQFVKISSSYMTAHINQDPSMFRHAEDLYTELIASAQDDYELQRDLRGFHNQIQDQIMDHLGEKPDPNASAVQLANEKFKHMHVFMNAGGKLMQHWSDKLAVYRERLVDMRRTESRNRDLMRMSVFAVAFAEIVMSISLAIYIIGGTVTKRLAVLVENAYRLPRGLPLESEVKGSDELSYLDQSLHEAADYLKEASEQRSLLMEMIAHDMRSPLMAAQIATELVAEMAKSAPDAVQRNIVKVKRNQETVINLVNDLLTIDRLESGVLALSKTTFALSPFVDEVIESVGPIATGKGIVLKNLTDAEMYVTADSDRITQVLTNLIANAVKFSPKGSTITISSAELHRFSQICVSDEGPGLPAGSEKKIFEKFNQVKREHAKAGYGLGLTICKMLVELHGGTIAAQSLKEKGSKFCFSLPHEHLM